MKKCDGKRSYYSGFSEFSLSVGSQQSAVNSRFPYKDLFLHMGKWACPESHYTWQQPAVDADVDCRLPSRFISPPK